MNTAADSSDDQPVALDDEPLALDPEAVEVLERRRHERLQIYLRVRWEGLFGCHEGTVSDISAGGCFVLSESRTTLRELLRMEVELHDGEWVKVWGEVTNQFPGVGFGVRYTEVDDEDEGKFSLSLAQTRSIKASVEALKQVNRCFVAPDGQDAAAEAVDRREFKRRIVNALHKVNSTLLDLPECEKKTALRLCVQAYADLHRVWAAMSGGGAVHPKELADAYGRLKGVYAAPPYVLEAIKRAEVAPVLAFLRTRAHIYFTFVS
ncbi:MAG TPA: PilZ domain-containing protein [Pyrinomonadaceae bacterium]|jgi:hypothetical protein